MKQKKYAITPVNSGAIVIVAKSKKEAREKLVEKGYKCNLKDIYRY